MCMHMCTPVEPAAARPPSRRHSGCAAPRRHIRNPKLCRASSNKHVRRRLRSATSPPSAAPAAPRPARRAAPRKRPPPPRPAPRAPGPQGGAVRCRGAGSRGRQTAARLLLGEAVLRPVGSWGRWEGCGLGGGGGHSPSQRLASGPSRWSTGMSYLRWGEEGLVLDGEKRQWGGSSRGWEGRLEATWLGRLWQHGPLSLCVSPCVSPCVSVCLRVPLSLCASVCLRVAR